MIGEHPRRRRFGDQIARASRAFQTKAKAQPGGALHLSLYWQALTKVESDYTVFIHLLDDSGAVRAQQDAPPVNGSYPTHLWEKDEIVQDT